MRLRGHALVAEGKPHLLDGCCAAEGNGGVQNYYDPTGHGRCTCGDASGCLASDADRKRWHREHKAEVARTYPVTGGPRHAAAASEGSGR